MSTNPTPLPADPPAAADTTPPAPAQSHEDDLLDEALEESYPASDPISITVDR